MMNTEMQKSGVIREARLKLHITQFRLSRRVGCSKSQITKIETGPRAGWFTTWLRRDPQFITRPEWDATAAQGDKCAKVFLGIIRHDDSIEVVAVRNCDSPDSSADHQHYWRDVFHKRWRWTKASGLFFWGGPEPTTEEKDRIERTIQRRVESLAAGASFEDPPYSGYIGLPWKNGGSSRAGVSCSGLVWLWLQKEMNFQASPPTLLAGTPMECRSMPEFKQSWQAGDVVFFPQSKVGPDRALRGVHRRGKAIAHPAGLRIARG